MRRCFATLASVLVLLQVVACRTGAERSGGTAPRFGGIAYAPPADRGSGPKNTGAPAAPIRTGPSALLPRAQAALEAGCKLFLDDAETATTAECLACHQGGGAATQIRTCHPIDIEYGRSSQPESFFLRPLDEVVRRGVFLPDGQIRCVTCHDRRSPWDQALALPPGATPRAAVRPGDPSTYDPGRTPPELVPGSRVSPKPLCLSCHDMTGD